MGTVYLAEQTTPVRRRVALKVLRSGRVTPALIARFEIERQALASVNHESIARLHDAGTTSEGLPWFAMEYVPGIPITEYCDRRRSSVNERLELFVDVCAALQHLHERGILHGDLKPANILVATEQGRPVPKLIDLGLARFLGDRSEDADAVSGTPAYMAPEQFRMPPAEIDPRADVYSVGMILHELLIGARPPHGQPGKSTPCARFASLGARARVVARQRSTSVRRLRLRLSGKLGRIAQRAIARAREDRHESAAALAEDLTRDLRRTRMWTRLTASALILGATAIASFIAGLNWH
jgi:serine/threonine protein kinase